MFFPELFSSEPEFIGLIFGPMFFLLYKSVIELPILLILFRPKVIQNKINMEKFLTYRWGVAILSILILLGIAIDDSRGFDVFSLYPFIYPVSVYLAFRLYRNRLITTWIMEKNV